MDRRRVVVTGIGLISPLGNDARTLLENLMAGKSGVRAFTIDGPKESYSNVAAPSEYNAREHFAPAVADQMDRVSQFSMTVASEAVKDSGLEFTDELRTRAGVSLGTGMGSTNSLEETFVQLLLRDPDRVRPLTVLQVMNNASAGRIAQQFGLSGPDLTYSCACSSSAVAIGEAMRQIQHGYADVMLAGGSEASLVYGFFKAWQAMRVLAPADRNDPTATCRPFSKNRSGLVLGEGAAMVVLEEREAAMARGAKIYGEVIGYGSSNDYSHITKPSVDGQARAMKLAITDARIAPEEVDYINAHGTATALNDSTETRAIKQVFGDHAYRLAVSSTKSMHGHLLGGAGALEFVISLLAMQNDAAPPTAHLEVPDPECDLDYVPGQGREQKIDCIASNSFAFGGTNAVLIARQ